jgi:hypothetical protein
MNQSPSLSGWTPLARGEQESDAINRCPGGHVHLDYGNFTVRFQRDEFLAFARMVAEASARLIGDVRPGPTVPLEFKPSIPISLN